MSTVEKVELENGVCLGEEMCGAWYKLTKEEARTVFSGTVSEIICHCSVCNDGRHDDTFEVEYRDGTIDIGCVHFSQEEVAAVKKWLGE